MLKYPTSGPIHQIYNSDSYEQSFLPTRSWWDRHSDIITEISHAAKPYATMLPAEISTPSIPGSYVLVIQIDQTVQLSVGALGVFRFDTAEFLYCGSARGPGGLRGRLSHHLKGSSEKRAHWHVDTLLDTASIKAIGYRIEGDQLECAWSRVLSDFGEQYPVGFGASDCRCPGHLIRLDPSVQAETALSALRGLYPGVSYVVISHEKE